MIGGMQRRMELHNKVLECFLQGNPWTKIPGIPLGVVHPGSMGTQMSDT